MPGVAEWYLAPRATPYQYLAVTWPALCVAFALLPAGRWLWTRRRVRAKAGRAFPVVTDREAISSRQPA
jgi:hypothetical protein